MRHHTPLPITKNPISPTGWFDDVRSKAGQSQAPSYACTPGAIGSTNSNAPYAKKLLSKPAICQPDNDPFVIIFHQVPSPNPTTDVSVQGWPSWTIGGILSKDEWKDVYKHVGFTSPYSLVIPDSVSKWENPIVDKLSMLAAQELGRASGGGFYGIPRSSAEQTAVRALYRDPIGLNITHWIHDEELRHPTMTEINKWWAEEMLASRREAGKPAPAMVSNYLQNWIGRMGDSWNGQTGLAAYRAMGVNWYGNTLYYSMTNPGGDGLKNVFNELLYSLRMQPNALDLVASTTEKDKLEKEAGYYPRFPSVDNVQRFASIFLGDSNTNPPRGPIPPDEYQSLITLATLDGGRFFFVFTNIMSDGHLGGQNVSNPALVNADSIYNMAKAASLFESTKHSFKNSEYTYNIPLQNKRDDIIFRSRQNSVTSEMWFAGSALSNSGSAQVKLSKPSGTLTNLSTGDKQSVSGGQVSVPLKRITQLYHFAPTGVTAPSTGGPGSGSDFGGSNNPSSNPTPTPTQPAPVTTIIPSCMLQTKVAQDGRLMLSWETTNAKEFSINGDPFSANYIKSDQIYISPTVSTTYIGRVVSATGHSASCTVTAGPVATTPNSTPTPNPSASFSALIDVGGSKTFKDSSNRTWSADYGKFAGGSIRKIRQPVKGKDGVALADTYLYQTQIYGSSTYKVTIPNGSYELKLYFADDGYLLRRKVTKANQRVFSVNIEGQSIPGLQNIDLFKEAGNKLNIGFIKTANVTVSDGELNLDFVVKAGFSLLNAIEIVGISGWALFDPLPGSVSGYLGKWSFNETGASAVDVSGQGATGFLVNGPTRVPGKIGNALHFDGVNDYVSVPGVTAPSSAITYTSWVNLEGIADTANDHRIIAALAIPGSESTHSFLAIGDWAAGNDTRISFAFNRGGWDNGNGAESNTHVPLTGWHHVAAVYDGSTVHFYLDGRLDSVKQIGKALPSEGAYELTIGTRGALTKSDILFEGSLDEVRVFNLALSASNVADIAASSMPVVLIDDTPPVIPTPTPSGGAASSDSVTDATGAVWTYGRTIDSRGKILLRNGVEQPPTAASNMKIVNGVLYQTNADEMAKALGEQNWWKVSSVDGNGISSWTLTSAPGFVAAAPTPAPTQSSPTTPTVPIPSASSIPQGGPSGYSSSGLVLNDNFGSSKAGANITNASQFNPSTPYGSNGTGWDRGMKFWNGGAGMNAAKVAMKPEWLELYPAGNNIPGMMVSHFEFMPTGNEHYYVELRGVTGRGGWGGPQSWPAFWFYSGNAPTDVNNDNSEFDGMEIWSNLEFGSTKNSEGLYTNYFAVASHKAPSASTVEGPIAIKTDNDITVNWNTYGWDFYKGSDGKIYMDTYFNGVKKSGLTQGLLWKDTPIAIIMGWNPGDSLYQPAVMKIDYVRVWKK